MKKLAISFSGGRTSAVMTKLCLERYAQTHEIVVTFANTGCEHPATLDFVRDCDNHWGFNTVWLEAIVGAPGVGIRHKVVNYETASRNGEPFEAYIAKYGIPHRGAPQCTSRLKAEVMESYLKREMGWCTTLGKRDYETAIGIRADEIDRISSQAEKHRFIYPLLDGGWTQDMVKAYMRKIPWDMTIETRVYGNCVWCWKKSLRKLFTAIKEDPTIMDFPIRMEAKYGHVKADNETGRRRFWKHGTAVEILEMASQPFASYEDSGQITIWDELLDVGGSCTDGCEIGNE